MISVGNERHMRLLKPIVEHDVLFTMFKRAAYELWMNSSQHWSMPNLYHEPLGNHWYVKCLWHPYSCLLTCSYKWQYLNNGEDLLEKTKYQIQLLAVSRKYTTIVAEGKVNNHLFVFLLIIQLLYIWSNALIQSSNTVHQYCDIALHESVHLRFGPMHIEDHSGSCSYMVI